MRKGAPHEPGDGGKVGQSTSVADRLVAAAFPVGAIGITIVLWEIAVRTGLVPRFLSATVPEVVAEIVVRWQLLVDHFLITGIEVVMGFAASVLIGVPLAIMIVHLKPFERAAYPLLVLTQTIPTIAVAPLLTVLFGFGLTSKVVIVCLVAFFPIVVSSILGLRALPQEMLWLARSMGARESRIFWKMRFPNALPSIFGGLKVSITLAVIGAVVGEFVGASGGLGYLVQVSSSAFRTELLFATLTVLGTMGMGLFGLISLFERRILHWHVSTRGEE